MYIGYETREKRFTSHESRLYTGKILFSFIDALSEAKPKDVSEPVIFDLDDREFKDLNKQSENVKPQNKKSDQFAGLGRDLYSHMRGSKITSKISE